MPNPIKGFQTKDGVRKYDYNELENLPENDPDDLALEVEEAKENIEAKKANIDGSYSSMTVGNAEQLVGTVGEEDSTPYNFRTSGGGIDIGDREEDMLVGGTICWNQLNMHPNSYTSSGVTITKNSDGSYTFRGTATGVSALQIVNSADSPTVGHKVLCLRSSTGTVVTLQTLGQNLTSSYIHVAVENDYYRLRVESGETVDETISAQIFDLTQMFGSTIADYIYNLEQAHKGDGVAWFKKLFPKDYYEYNEGELMSVKTSAHKMVGFNAWDEEYEIGGLSIATGEEIANSSYLRSKNFIPVISGATYYRGVGYQSDFRVFYYDADKNYVSSVSMSSTGTFTIPTDIAYIKFHRNGSTYKNNICINLSWDGERDGEYEEYEEHVYPLDSSLELRGIPKLDSANNLYYDGDTYESDGTVTRKYGVVVLDGSADENWSKETNTSAGAFAMQISGIENRFVYSDAAEIKWRSNYLPPIAPRATWGDFNSFISVKGITEDSSSFVCGISTITTVANWRTHLSSNPLVVVYELEEPTTETAEPYVNPQIVNDFGTEEYVDERAVPIPVGHETTYMANLRAKLEMAPDSPSADGEYIVKQTNGQNEYIALGSSTTMQSIMAKLPNPPSEDGTYTLKVTVANGTATYSWGE